MAPEYLYQHPKKKKLVKAVVQRMTEPHTYEEDGIEWTRIFTIPQGSVPLKIDHNSAKDFAHKTKHTKDNIGGLVDRSLELSEKRSKESDTGRDKVKDSYLDKWSKKRKGKKHPDDNR